MERTITFIAEDKKREHQGMENESEIKVTQPQHPQVLETETPDSKLEMT